MGITHFQYFLLFVSAFAVVGFLTPVMRRIAIRQEIFDAPTAAHKTHKEPVPYLGGVAIIIGVLLVSYGATIAKRFTMHNFWLETSVLGPALVLGIIGLIDDLRNLRPAPRFVFQTVAGVFTAWLLIATNPVVTSIESKAIYSVIAVVWTVGICNSINFFDNLDGGAAGTVAVSSAMLFVIAFRGGQFLVASLAAVTAGATIGFLLWNKSPARIYMGDAGALFLGILIASLTLRLHPSTQPRWTHLFVAALLLAVPILDTSVAVTSRLRRGVSPFQGGHDHLSHRLIRGGVSRPLAAISLWALSGVFAGAAFLVTVTERSGQQVVVGSALVVWVVLFIKFSMSADA